MKKPIVPGLTAIALSATLAIAQTVMPASVGVTAKGRVLTNASGMTLYTFDKDADGKSACAGPCAQNWPPFAATANASASGDWSLVTRDDGSKQWAHKGKPLYGWSKDAVPAAQEKHLVQWLSKRLRQPLAAPDLAPYGFTLSGGRLLPTSEDVGAQFMYENARGERLTLYVRAGETGTTAFRLARRGDLSTFYWIDRGLGFALTAQEAPERLTPLAQAVYRQIEGDAAR